jgi:hypothetical protein
MQGGKSLAKPKQPNFNRQDNSSSDSDERPPKKEVYDPVAETESDSDDAVTESEPSQNELIEIERDILQAQQANAGFEEDLSSQNEAEVI